MNPALPALEASLRAALDDARSPTYQGLLRLLTPSDALVPEALPALSTAGELWAVRALWQAWCRCESPRRLIEALTAFADPARDRAREIERYEWRSLERLAHTEGWFHRPGGAWGRALRYVCNEIRGEVPCPLLGVCACRPSRARWKPMVEDDDIAMMAAWIPEPLNVAL